MATEFVDKQWRIPNSWNVDESNQGKISNYSMKFDGISDIVNTTLTPPTGANDRTISVWFKTGVNAFENICGYGTAATSQGFDICTHPSPSAYSIGVHAYGPTIIANGVYIPNQWNHYAVTYDGTILRGYLNGEPVNTSTIALNTGTSVDFTIGGGAYTASNDYSGSIDQVSVFDYVLSASQVSTLYGNNSAGYFQIGNPMALTPNPVAFYPLGDQDVQQTVDSTDWRIPNQVATSLSSYVFDFPIRGVVHNVGVSNEANVFDNATNFSFSGWFKIEDLQNSNIFEIKEGNNYRFNINYFTSANGQIRFNVNSSASGAFSYVTGANTFASDWFHYAGIFDGNGASNTDKFKLYINGSPVTLTFNGTLPTNMGSLSGNNTINLGNAISSTFQSFDGKASSIQMWNTSLLQSEVETLYNNGTPYTSIPPQSSNLQFWYKLNAQDTFDGTNWTIKDYGLVGADLTSVGMTSANLVSSSLPNAAAGYSPWAIDLDGIDDNFTIDNSSEDLNVEYLTASVWFKPEVSEFATLIGNRYFDNGFMSWAVQTATNGRIRYIQKTPGVGSSFYTTDTYNVDEWNHVAVTYSSGVATIYLNGGTPITKATSLQPIQYDTGFVSTNVTIGSAPAGGSPAAPTGPTQHFDGQLSNVAVWNSVLSSSQIATIYNNGIPGDISSLNPLAWWELGVMTGFNSGIWTAISNTKTNYAAVSEANMTEGDLVNGPGYSTNATGTSTLVLEKQAPYSFNNALSENMAVSNRDDSQASDSSPLIIELDLSDETGSYVYSGAVVNASAVYPYTVDWGDGNVESITSSAQLVSSRLNHTYNADEYPRPVVQIGRSSDTGRITQFQINAGGSRLKLVNVKQFGTNPLRIFDIEGCTNAIITALDKLKITENLTDAFKNTRANPASINTWDVSTIGSMQYLISGNNDFNQDLNNWDTSSATNMFRIFFYARKFNGNISNWNINSVAKTHLGNMFSNANSFNQDVDTKYISAANSPSGSEYIAWDTDGFTTMSACFNAAYPFNGNCGNWNTSAVTTMALMFLSADLNQDLSTRTVTIASGTPIAKTYKAWDVKNVTTFQQFLESSSNFNQVLYDWELSTNLTSMLRMFRYCSGISASNYAKNWGIFANSVKDDNSGSGGAASGRPKDVNASLNGIQTTPLSVGEPCPISSDGITQHFTTVGRAMSYLTSDVQITFIEEEQDPEQQALQLYTANFLQTPGSDFPTQLVGVSVPDFTFEWSGTVWEFKKSGTTLDTDTGGATLQEGPEDGTWNILTVVTANQNWNYGKGGDPGLTYMI
jgi:hypothetical protein